MTTLEWIITIIVILIFVLPILSYICTKWGVVGYFKGKEAFRKRKKYIDVTTMNDKKRKYEKF